MALKIGGLEISISEDSPRSDPVTPEGGNIIQEDGFDILLESGDLILME